MSKYILDVRTKAEYDAGHANDAIHHDIMDMMYGKFPEIPKDAEIIMYCESGNRAMMAKSMMENAGYTNVTNGGSINDIIS